MTLNLEEFDELKNVKTDLHCVDVDLRDKELVSNN